jgi:N-acetylglucosaminyl-diphospho-decaprenol L-rhamnosyltransferase
MDISIVIPVFNQLHFTKICIESLQATLLRDGEIIVIDNGSSDGTAEYLLGFSNIRIITNGGNLGCAVAWNQGVKASNGSWIAILNNDIILSTNWLDGLLDFAREKNVDIVSPAFREGEYNYNIAAYSREYVQRMYSVARMGIAQGICFVVRRRVFDKIGLFDENFKIGQSEDTDFFRRARIAVFTLGTTGRSFIHHFGSITQDSIRKKGNVKSYKAENRSYFRRKWRLTWWKRFLERRYVKLRDFRWRTSEKTLHGHTLIEKWVDGRVRYL